MYNHDKSEGGVYEISMKRLILAVLVGGLVLVSVIVGCTQKETEKPEGTLSIAELLGNPVYDTEVTIYGEVSLFGQLNCPCFELTSDGDKIQVWYNLMIEDDGAERPEVSVAGVADGKQVIVTGELKTAGEHRSLNDFWASEVKSVCPRLIEY